MASDSDLVKFDGIGPGAAVALEVGAAAAGFAAVIGGLGVLVVTDPAWLRRLEPNQTFKTWGGSALAAAGIVSLLAARKLKRRPLRRFTQGAGAGLLGIGLLGLAIQFKLVATPGY